MNPSAASIPSNILLEHGSFVRSLAYSLLRDEQLAEDAAQETWMRWIQNPPEEQGRTRGWLATVVRGVALSRASSRRARRNRELAAPVPENAADPALELEQAELIKTMVEGVIELEEPLQSAVLLTFFRGWSTRRIAQEQGISASTVSQRVKRGLHELRGKLDREHAGNRETWCNAMGAIAGNGTLGSSVPAGMSTALSLLPWSAAALLLVIAVTNWSAPQEKAAIAVKANPSPEVVTPALLSAELPEQVREQRADSSERRAVVAATPKGKLRLSGQVINQAYPELGMPETPAANLELNLQAGRAGTYSLPNIRLREALDGVGRFDLVIDDPGLRPLRLSLFVESSKEYHLAALATVLEEGQNELLDVQLKRMACGVLTGVVVDEAGAPLPGIQFTLSGRFGQNAVEQACAADKHGHFQVKQFFPTRSVSIQTPGYALIQSTGGEVVRNAEGEVQAGWSELRVRLAAASTLRVRVLNPEGRGVPGARVSASLHVSELAPLDVQQNPYGVVSVSTHTETDSEGFAVLPRVWANKRMSVGVHVNRESYETSRVMDGKLLFDETGDGEEILLGRGEHRELVAHWDVLYTLQGTVIDPAGSVVPDVRLKVFDGGAPNPYLNSILTLETNAGGEFSGELLRRHVVGPLVLVAEKSLEEESPEPASGLGGLGYAGTAPPVSGAGIHVASLSLALDSAVDRVLTGTLHLERTFALAGKVRSGGGTSATDAFGGAPMWAVPAGSGSHLFKAALGTKFARAQEGTFRFTNLPRGRYDIYVSQEMKGLYSFTSFIHCFEGLAAGEENLDLVVPEQGVVQIKVRVHGVESDGMTVLHGRYFPTDPGAYEKPSAPELQNIRSLSGWPLGAPLRFAGISGERTEEAQAAFGLYGTDGVGDHDLPPMGAGWYTIGVKVVPAEDGTGYWPMATPVQYFEPGHYIFDYYPVETVSTFGLVSGSGPVGIWIVDGEGMTFPRGSDGGAGKLNPFTETNASGEFKLAAVPVGEWRVRLGKPSDLARGEYEREVLVKFYEGMPDLMLDL